jgi:hypothetical protein
MNQSNETQHGRSEMEPGGQSASPKCPLVALELASYAQRPKNSNWNLQVARVNSIGLYSCKLEYCKWNLIELLLRLRKLMF